MESLKQAATLLYAILGDMDKIPVEGLNNQKTFLGCADGIQTAAQVILQFVQTEKDKQAAHVQAPVAENINTEVTADGR